MHRASVNPVKVLRENLIELKNIFRGNVGALAISWLLFSLTGSLINPFFAKYAKDLGATDYDIAFMRSLGMLALALSLIPGGVLTDYMGRVKVILVGTGLISIIQFLYAAAPDWRFLTAVYVLDSAAHFYQPALTAIIMDSLNRGEEFKGFLGLNIITAIPGLFMPIIGGFLYDTIGVTGVKLGFVLQGIVAVIVLVLRVKTLRETFKPKDRDLSKIILELAGYRGVLFKALKIYVFTSILWQISMGVFNTYASLYVIDVLNLSKLTWGVISAFSTLGSITASLLLINSKINTGTSALRSAVIISLSMFALALPMYVHNGFITIGLLITISLVASIASNVMSSAISALLTKMLPVEIRGRAVGIQRLLDNIGASMASQVAALLYVGLGYAEAFIASGVMGLLSCVYLYATLLRKP
ncbi:MAG: MFS transporter [Desulfurococcaceae archaeon]